MEIASWVTSTPMIEKRNFAAISPSPISKNPHSLFVSGGTNGTTQSFTSEFLNDEGWEFSDLSPLSISHHCMVKVNSFTTMAIGGQSIQKIKFSENSYVLDTHDQVWKNGPSLNIAKDCISCARIRENEKSLKFSIIVAAGCNGAHLKSTEILDENSYVWRLGPQLPIGICCAALVEDAAGGVVLVSILPFSFSALKG